MRSGFKVLAGIAATLLLAACAGAPQPFHAGALPGELIHKDSGFAFPARIGSFARVHGQQYDARGRDISVGYNGDIPSVVTVYVYPSGGRDLEAVLISDSAGVLASYPRAEGVVGRRTIRITPHDISAEVVSLLAMSAVFFGKEQQLHSELVLAQHDARFVKYRITYPVSIADLAAEDAGNFPDAFLLAVIR